MESVLSVLHTAKRNTKLSDRMSGESFSRTVHNRKKGAGKTREKKRSLSELPEDLQNVLRLKKALKKLDEEKSYISAGAYQQLLQAGQRDLKDLQVLRKKGMLDLYCRKNGLHSARAVEEILDLSGAAEEQAAGSTEPEKCKEVCKEGFKEESKKEETDPGSGSNKVPGKDTGKRISGAGSATPAWVRAHNARYLDRALQEEQDYLDHVLDAVDPQIRLDDAQRRMILTDEDNCLVIAGAGAGKTTSVAAKVKYLVDRKGVKPEEILVISFTNKAVEELRARRQTDLGIPCPSCTFLSAGNAVLHMQNPERVNIVDADKKFFVVRDYLRGKVLQDPRMVHSLILFFASYFDAPLDEKNLEAFFRGIAQMRYTTMRSELDEYCTEIMDAQRKKKVTIRNEVLRSAQEVEIANFLYRNGIDYVYEPVYRYHIELARKPYTPDFLIRQGDREIYIEHFGITRDGKNSRDDETRLQAYQDAVNEKVLLHRRHGTELI